MCAAPSQEAPTTKSTLNASSALSQDELKAKFNEYKPYLLNFKTIAAILLLIFSLYASVTNIPGKIGDCFNAYKRKDEAVKRKSNLKNDKAQLEMLLKALEKIETQPIKVQTGSSPELAAIDVAQQVISLAESMQNQYVSLSPLPPITIDVDSVVSLPVAGSAAAPSPTPMPAAPAAPGAPAAPPAAPVPAATSPTGAKVTFNAFQYVLEINGPYISVANFIHDLVKMRAFIIINNIELMATTNAQPVTLNPALFNKAKVSTPNSAGSAPAAAPGASPASPATPGAPAAPAVKGKPGGAAAPLILGQAPPGLPPGLPSTATTGKPPAGPPANKPIDVKPSDAKPGDPAKPAAAEEPAKLPTGPMQVVTLRLTFTVPWY